MIGDPMGDLSEMEMYTCRAIIQRRLNPTDMRVVRKSSGVRFQTAPPYKRTTRKVREHPSIVLAA